MVRHMIARMQNKEANLGNTALLSDLKSHSDTQCNVCGGFGHRIDPKDNKFVEGK